MKAYSDHLTRKVDWVGWNGESAPISVCPQPRMVGMGLIKASALDLRFRNPGAFTAGEIHNHTEEWYNVLKGQGNEGMVGKWIKNGVSVFDFVTAFKGTFRGKRYDSAFPPSIYLPNNKICEKYIDFISETIKERVRSGALEIWGEVGKVEPPYIVMPLTVEPTKPRLCHDERFLNNWMKTLPFRLDHITQLPRYLDRGHFQTKLDDKSGYDHVMITMASRALLGIQWGGWWYVCATLPFGWKCSPYIYQTIGLCAMNEIRKCGVPSSLYIDDRHAGQIRNCTENTWSNMEKANAACYIMSHILISLGYYLALEKCIFIPTQTLEFLGFKVDTVKTIFSITQRKREKFAELREHILNQSPVSVKTLQRMMGKCVSLTVAIPSAKLYIREMALALSRAGKDEGIVYLHPKLQEEIESWRRLDTGEGYSPWKEEKHVIVTIASDASQYGWGGTVMSGRKTGEIRDYWGQDLQEKPIAYKESKALEKTLLSFHERTRNTRVIAYTDNETLMHCWKNRGSKSSDMNNALKSLYEVVDGLDIEIEMRYIPSRHNPADPPSRRLTPADARLLPEYWERIDREFGGKDGHSVDLMALDSNAQHDRNGTPLRHFTPWETPNTSGVDVFAQNITGENCYVFPPFQMVGPILKLVKEQKGLATFVIPKLSPMKYWWPIVQGEAKKLVELAPAGEYIFEVPNKKGWIRVPSLYDIWACKMDYRQ
ncbi:uncharacterized protein LOC144451313 [Glandiceps talaboti]